VDGTRSQQIIGSADMEAQRAISPPGSNAVSSDKKAASSRCAESKAVPRWHLCVVVYALPFLDAFIVRLPFCYITMHLIPQSKVAFACLTLFSFQIARALTQSIQIRIGEEIFCWLSTTFLVFAYAMVIMLHEAGSNHWDELIPIALTGFTETLPVQKTYIFQLLEPKSGRLECKHCLMQSYAGIGLGSAVTYLSAALLYTLFNFDGIGYLGVAVGMLKLGTLTLISVAVLGSSH